MRLRQPDPNFIILGLFLLLILSIALNWIQTNHIDRLLGEIEDMEYVQSRLSSHIEQLEAREGDCDEWE